MLLKLLPELPSNGPTDFNKWLEFTSSFINKKLTTSAAAAQNISSNNNSKVNSNNSHNMNGNESISSNTTSSSDVNSSSEALLLQNAQLQKSLDEYKNIVADTVMNPNFKSMRGDFMQIYPFFYRKKFYVT